MTDLSLSCLLMTIDRSPSKEPQTLIDRMEIGISLIIVALAYMSPSFTFSIHIITKSSFLPEAK